MQATWKSETVNQFYFLVIPPAVIKVRWLEYVVHIHTENFQRFICPCVVKNSDDQRSPFAWSTTIIRWLYPGGKVCVTGGHSTRVVLPTTKRGGKEKAWERGWFTFGDIYIPDDRSSSNRLLGLVTSQAYLCRFCIISYIDQSDSSI